MIDFGTLLSYAIHYATDKSGPLAVNEHTFPRLQALSVLDGLIEQKVRDLNRYKEAPNPKPFFIQKSESEIDILNQLKNAFCGFDLEFIDIWLKVEKEFIALRESGMAKAMIIHFNPTPDKNALQQACYFTIEPYI